MGISNSKHERFIRSLREHIGFIHSSSIAFDQGTEGEALRIAVSLRVLFRNTTTRSMTSLIRHLGRDEYSMLSSSQGFGDWRDYIAIQIAPNTSTPVSARPLLGSKFTELSIAEWWEREVVFTYKGESYSREKIVCSAADKDGGAHVDAKLQEYYEYLCRGEFGISITGNLTFEGEPPFEQGVPQHAPNIHLTLLRQFGHEVLSAASYFKWVPDDV